MDGAIQMIHPSGMNLKTYLEQERLTASDFARQIGVYPSTITRAAKGEAMPSPSLMKQIMDATQGAVSPNDWFEGVA